MKMGRLAKSILFASYSLSLVVVTFTLTQLSNGNTSNVEQEVSVDTDLPINLEDVNQLDTTVIEEDGHEYIGLLEEEAVKIEEKLIEYGFITGDIEKDMKLVIMKGDITKGASIDRYYNIYADAINLSIELNEDMELKSIYFLHDDSAITEEVEDVYNNLYAVINKVASQQTSEHFEINNKAINIEEIPHIVAQYGGYDYNNSIGTGLLRTMLSEDFAYIYYIADEQMTSHSIENTGNIGIEDFTNDKILAYESGIEDYSVDDGFMYNSNSIYGRVLHFDDTNLIDYMTIEHYNYEYENNDIYHVMYTSIESLFKGMGLREQFVDAMSKLYTEKPLETVLDSENYTLTIIAENEEALKYTVKVQVKDGSVVSQ